MTLEVEDLSSGPTIHDLTRPYYVAWWITNRCNLICTHCINDSGPFNQFEDELSEHEMMRVCREILELEVPYGSLTGGEPLLHKNFFKIAEILSDGGVSLNIETDGQLVNKEVARRIAKIGVRSVQVSIDGATQQTYGIIRRTISGVASLSKALEAIKLLSEEGVMVTVSFAPTRYSINEAGKLIDMVYELGARVINTGRLMRVGRAAQNWRWLSPTEEQYRAFFDTLRKKAKEYMGKLRIVYYPYSVVEELKYRLNNPAASFVIMPNGKVKMMGSMPFICADLRRHSLREAWERYKLAWRSPAVKEFIEKVQEDESLLAKNNDLVEIEVEQLTV